MTQGAECVVQGWTVWYGGGVCGTGAECVVRGWSVWYGGCVRLRCQPKVCSRLTGGLVQHRTDGVVQLEHSTGSVLHLSAKVLVDRGSESGGPG